MHKFTITLEQAELALSYVPADDRETWWRMAMALKSEFGEAAHDAWHQWSQQDDSYNANDARRVWESIGNGKITIGTLIHEARQHGWQPEKPPRRLSFAEQQARRLKLAAEAQQAESERLRREAGARGKAREMWGRNNRANPQHPYLIAKQVQPFTLRQFKDVLMVPLVDTDGLVNLQFIQPDGAKRFLTGGKKNGTYSPIGGIKNDIIYICEGWATGASIHMLTGEAVACAMNEGNLLAVAQMMRARYPNTTIVIAGDNDHHKKENTGAIKAREAALAVRGEVMLPEFPKGHSGTDWNDWHAMQSAKEVSHA